jgi:hypothetical protein
VSSKFLNDVLDQKALRNDNPLQSFRQNQVFHRVLDWTIESVNLPL